MTVPATARRAGPFNGNGVATSFPFTFKVFTTSDLRVVFVDTDGVETDLVLDSDYSVTLNPDQDVAPGGSIIYPISGSPLAVGEQLAAVGNLDYDQVTDLLNGGSFNAQIIENAFDRIVVQVQQLAEENSRQLELSPVADPDVVSSQLPAPVAGNIIGWDDTATALRNVDPTTLASVVAYADWRTDTFDGTGAQTQFVLSADPGTAHNCDVAIAGVVQTPAIDFTVSGTTLTFTNAPPAGTDNIAVRYGQALPIGTATSDLVAHSPAGVGAVGTSLREFLRRRVHVFDYLTSAQKADVLARTETLDTSDAITAALTALRAIGGGELVFNFGFYRVNAPLVVDFDACHFVGAGARASVIRVHHDTGPAITVQHATNPGASYINGFGMREISVRARTETTQGAALKLNKAQLVTLTNLFLEDNFGGLHVLGGASHYISGLHIFSPRASAPVSWSGAKAGSFFYKVEKSSDGQVPTEIFLANFNFRRTETSNYIENGIVVYCVDGLWLSNGHVMGTSANDMLVQPVNGDDQITGIKMSNIWLDNNTPVGLRVVGATSASFGEIEMDGVRFLTPANIGIFVEASATGFEGIRMTGGAIRKAGNNGVLIRAGKRHIFAAVDFGACNTNGSTNQGAIVVDDGADKVQVTGCAFDETALGVTATGMIGVRVNAAASTQVQVTGSQFALTALDISDSSTSDLNVYEGNTTTKPATATSISGSSLVLAEVGTVFTVSDGLNFNNLTGRWDGRSVVLVFAGASTVTHTASGSGIKLKSGANLSATAGITLRLTYSADRAQWMEA